MSPSDSNHQTRQSIPAKRPGIQNTMSVPSQWVHMYDEFITKNAHQVSQIESTLRSLTYIIPGRFRDAEIASESIHSGVQLLSLYHDTLLRRAHTLTKLPVPPSLSQPPAPHGRYTRFWTLKSALYRRVAYVLQIVHYVELLCEMAAKRRGERTRWRVVILLEAIKAVCKLLLMRITRSRPLVTPILPEREPIPEEPPEGEEEAESGELGEDDEDRRNGGAYANGSAHHQRKDPSQLGPNGEWTMPRTGMSFPSLPGPGDTSGYLLSRVLAADDIKPAAKLLNRLQGQAQAAEVLHILAPLIFAVALARSKNKRKAWTPWLLGVGAELAARQLRDRGLRTTPLEREEWGKRGWGMGWWVMRGAFYENVTKGVVEGVRRRMPGLLSGILEDYEYLWENYHFSTSS
ncbi:peroxisomal membrane protein PEX16 [Chaetomidium leptoderma]|uniref:Peroxisomal membrane protein PEX16 n=1 Tax=Chaetomidium leptoderma TaxID=669021 RepID=A0AAN6ZU84_9PEZI|nr:peroxisomal membrane protein PEX16 [Chaetomidium leptoderma]